MTAYKKFLFSINLINILLLLVGLVLYSNFLHEIILFMFISPVGTLIGLLQLLMVALIATPPIFMLNRLIKNKYTNEDNKYLTIYVLINLMSYSIPFIVYFADYFGYLDSSTLPMGLLIAGIGILIFIVCVLMMFWS